MDGIGFSAWKSSFLTTPQLPLVSPSSLPMFKVHWYRHFRATGSFFMRLAVSDIFDDSLCSISLFTSLVWSPTTESWAVTFIFWSLHNSYCSLLSASTSSFVGKARFDTPRFLTVGISLLQRFKFVISFCRMLSFSQSVQNLCKFYVIFLSHDFSKLMHWEELLP